MKIKCTKCNVEKDESQFYKNKRYASGYMTWCKSCHREYYRQPEQKEKLKVLQQKWNKAHKSEIKEYQRLWYIKHKKHKNELTNRRCRERWASDSEYRKRKNFQKKPHNSSRRRIKQKGDLTYEQWTEICENFGNICLCCGSPDITVDHIIPLTRGGTHTKDNVQPLCANCNSSKNTLAIDYRWRWFSISTYKFGYAVGA